MISFSKATGRSLLAFLFLLGTSVSGATEPCPSLSVDKLVLYRVRKGESLSEILVRRLAIPLWGRGGYVHKVFALNKHRISNSNLIVEGQLILVPKACYIKKKSPSAGVSKAKPARKIAHAHEGPERHIEAQVNTLSEKSADSHFLVSLGSGFSRIDSIITSNNTLATLLSEQAISAYIQWEQYWTETLHSFIAWGYERLPFQSATHGVLFDGVQSATEINLGSRFRLSPLWESEFVLGVGDYGFVTSDMKGTARLEMRSLPKLQLQFLRDLAIVRSLSLKGGFGVAQISSSSGPSYDIKSGYTLFGLMRVAQELECYTLFGDVEYSEMYQNTSITTQSRKDIRGRLGFLWKL